MFPGELRIRDLVIRPALVLAPMAGVTDTVFRRMIRELGGCGLIMTEFTSSEGVVRSGAGSAKTMRYLYYEEDERPISAQLFGANPEVMARAAAMVEELGFDAVDINLGCPAKKVVKCGGAGLLRDLPLLEKILRAVRSAVKIPLTIKMRAGWDEKSIVACEVARMAEQIGVEAIAVHPRTRMQGLEGRADWSIIRQVKETVKIPVIGNGDVTAPEDAVRMVRETGCDAVMIGRSAAIHPWIFRQIVEYVEKGEYARPSEAERHALLARYFRAFEAAQMPDALGKMKQFACWFTHGVRNGAALRRGIHAAKSTREVLCRVDEFFAHSAAAAAGGSMVS